MQNKHDFEKTAAGRWRDSYVSTRLCTWASYQIRKITGVHAPGMPGTFSRPPRVSDPDMHHGMCVTHVIDADS